MPKISARRLAQRSYEAFAAGIGDHKIVTTLCPGGKERMRRLMDVVRHGRVDLTPLLTHTFTLDQIGEAYKLFGERLDGVMNLTQPDSAPPDSMPP